MNSNWNKGLKHSLHDKSLIVFRDDIVTIIRDKYPKAKYHYLVMPNSDISTIRDLNWEHVSLLKHMDDMGREYMENNHYGVSYRAGYHAVPSMIHLHMHVISQDFISACLKTKRHWNSFTTPYFVDSKDIITQVANGGKVTIIDPKTADAHLKAPLRCNQCSLMPKNLPQLKDHLLKHLSS